MYYGWILIENGFLFFPLRIDIKLNAQMQKTVAVKAHIELFAEINANNILFCFLQLLN